MKYILKSVDDEGNEKELAQVSDSSPGKSFIYLDVSYTGRFNMLSALYSPESFGKLIRQIFRTLIKELTSLKHATRDVGGTYWLPYRNELDRAIEDLNK